MEMDTSHWIILASALSEVWKERWITLLFGVIEGVTEFLPISSTGHLIIVQKLLGEERSEFFNVGIQVGAVLAIVLIYWRRLLELTLHCARKSNRDYLYKLTAAFCITAVLGLLSRKLGFKLSDSSLVAVTSAVWLGAFAILGVEWKIKREEGIKKGHVQHLSHKERGGQKHGAQGRDSHFESMSESISWPAAIVAGFAQLIAGVFPGTSRSMATILGTMLCGVSRTASAEFSFILGIPTMFAASGYMLLSQIREKGVPALHEIEHFTLGFISSMAVAFVVVKWLLGYIQSHNFTPFAWYRIALGIVLIILIYNL